MNTNLEQIQKEVAMVSLEAVLVFALRDWEPPTKTEIWHSPKSRLKQDTSQTQAR